MRRVCSRTRSSERSPSSDSASVAQELRVALDGGEGVRSCVAGVRRKAAHAGLGAGANLRAPSTLSSRLFRAWPTLPTSVPGCVSSGATDGHVIALLGRLLSHGGGHGGDPGQGRRARVTSSVPATPTSGGHRARPGPWRGRAWPGCSSCRSWVAQCPHRGGLLAVTSRPAS